MADVNAIAEARGGKCLSTNYVNNRVKLLWQCAEGHKFQMSFKAVDQHGYWCTTCSGKYRFHSHKELSQLAQSREGTFLSIGEQFKTSQKVRWRCIDGHTWTAQIFNVVSNGSWCPKCRVYLGEEIVRNFLERVFNAPFPKTKPPWLLTDRHTRLELDGYNEPLKLAFEHQGRHHYEGGQHLHGRNVEKQRDLDRQKRQLCEQHGIALIEIPELNKMLPLDGLAQAVSQQLKQLGRAVPANLEKTPVTHAGIYASKRLTDLNNVAVARGGQCLEAAWLGNISLHRFRCAKGHTWTARPNDVKKGSWCAVCSRAGGKKKTLLEMQQLARLKGGACLSESYVNSKQKLEWSCSVGHTWFSRYDVAKDRWCPLCRFGIGKVV